MHDLSFKNDILDIGTYNANHSLNCFSHGPHVVLWFRTFHVVSSLRSEALKQAPANEL